MDEMDEAQMMLHELNTFNRPPSPINYISSLSALQKQYENSSNHPYSDKTKVENTKVHLVK
jgi:hypothetical protein